MPDRRRTPLQGLRRLASRARARGVTEVLRLAAERVVENLRSDETLIFYRQDAHRIDLDAGDLTRRKATPGDAGRYAIDIGTDSPMTFQDRLADDVMCYLVEDGNVILHASWITTSSAWTRELRRHLSPPPGDAYIYESFTRADARGKGAYRAALAGILTEMAALGIKRVWVAVEETNEPSRRAVGRAGFQPVFSLPYRRRFGRLTIGAPEGDEPDAAAGFLKGTGPGG